MDDLYNKLDATYVKPVMVSTLLEIQLAKEAALAEAAKRALLRLSVLKLGRSANEQDAAEKAGIIMNALLILRQKELNRNKLIAADALTFGFTPTRNDIAAQVGAEDIANNVLGTLAFEGGMGALRFAPKAVGMALGRTNFGKSLYLSSSLRNAEPELYNVKKGILDSLRFTRTVTSNTPDVRYGYAGDGSRGFTQELFDNLVQDFLWRLENSGHDISNLTRPTIRQFSPETDLFDAKCRNSGAGAWFTPAANDVTFRGNFTDQNLGLAMHEYSGHGLRYNLFPEYLYPGRSAINDLMSGKIQGNRLSMNAMEVFTPEESDLLLKVYEPLFKGGPAETLSPERKLHEAGAINTQGRTNISSRYNHITKLNLNKAIVENTPLEDVIYEYKELNYTRNGVIDLISKETGLEYEDIMFMSPQELKSIVENSPTLLKLALEIKDSWIKIAGVALPTTVGTSAIESSAELFKKGGKSKIRIKKENRGKFTASAKAHGKGVQEYARSVINNPNATTLQKKRAQFALNAKKWNH